MPQQPQWVPYDPFASTTPSNEWQPYNGPVAKQPQWVPYDPYQEMEDSKYKDQPSTLSSAWNTLAGWGSDIFNKSVYNFSPMAEAFAKQVEAAPSWASSFAMDMLPSPVNMALRGLKSSESTRSPHGHVLDLIPGGHAIDRLLDPLKQRINPKLPTGEMNEGFDPRLVMSDLSLGAGDVANQNATIGNIGMMGAGAAAKGLMKMGAPALSSAATWAERAMGAPQVASGARNLTNIATGEEPFSWGGLGSGAMETGFGLMGMGASKAHPSAPKLPTEATPPPPPGGGSGQPMLPGIDTPFTGGNWMPEGAKYKEGSAFPIPMGPPPPDPMVLRQQAFNDIDMQTSQSVSQLEGQRVNAIKQGLHRFADTIADQINQVKRNGEASKQSWQPPVEAPAPQFDQMPEQQGQLPINLWRDSAGSGQYRSLNSMQNLDPRAFSGIPRGDSGLDPTFESNRDPNAPQPPGPLTILPGENLVQFQKRTGLDWLEARRQWRLLNEAAVMGQPPPQQAAPPQAPPQAPPVQPLPSAAARPPSLDPNMNPGGQGDPMLAGSTPYSRAVEVPSTTRPASDKIIVKNPTQDQITMLERNGYIRTGAEESGRMVFERQPSTTQAAPPAASQVPSIPGVRFDNENLATLMSPSNENIKALKQMGFVPDIDLRSPEGRPQMVRNQLNQTAFTQSQTKSPNTDVAHFNEQGELLVPAGRWSPKLEGKLREQGVDRVGPDGKGNILFKRRPLPTDAGVLDFRSREERQQEILDTVNEHQNEHQKELPFKPGELRRPDPDPDLEQFTPVNERDLSAGRLDTEGLPTTDAEAQTRQNLMDIRNARTMDELELIQYDLGDQAPYELRRAIDQKMTELATGQQVATTVPTPKADLRQPSLVQRRFKDIELSAKEIRDAEASVKGRPTNSLSYAWGRDIVEGAGKGKPGIEVLDDNGDPYIDHSIPTNATITYRGPNGEPVATAEVTMRGGRRPNAIHIIASDNRSGLFGKGLLEVVKEAIKMKALRIEGTFSEHTKNFMESLRRITGDSILGDDTGSTPIFNRFAEAAMGKDINMSAPAGGSGGGGGRKPPQMPVGTAPEGLPAPMRKAIIEKSYLRKWYDLVRGITTTGDLSAALRQGSPLLFTKQWRTAFGKMIDAVGSEKASETALKAIMERPMFKDGIDLNTGDTIKSFAKQAGMKIGELDNPLNPREETIAGDWAETGGMFGKDVPYLNRETGLQKAYAGTVGRYARSSNRAYNTFLNQLRADTFESLIKQAKSLHDVDVATGGKLGAKNPMTDLVFAKEIAEFVNTATGRGPLKIATPTINVGKGISLGMKERSFEQHAKLFTDIMFAPRLVSRSMRMLNPATYMMATPFVRQQYLKAALNVAGLWVGTATAAKIAGADVSLDSNSADFGKIRIGDTRIDPGQGFQQYIVAASRLITGHTTSSSTGSDFELGQGFRAPTRWNTAENFLVNKTHPVVKFGHDIFAASQYQPFQVGDRTAQLFVPLIVGDVYELVKKNPEMLPALAPIMFGMGSQTYDKGESISRFIPREYDFTFGGGGLYPGEDQR